MEAMTSPARILLIAHAPLAQALRACAVHVLGSEAGDVLALDIAAHEAPDASLARARALLAAPGSNAGAALLVLGDLPGGTPCNVARCLVAQLPGAALVGGVNLPMLLRAINYRHEALPQLVARAVAGGCRAVAQLMPADGADAGAVQAC